MLRNRLKRPTHDSESATAQVGHFLGLAREGMKQLTSRTLVILTPMLLATIATTEALEPHLKAIDTLAIRLEQQSKTSGSTRKAALDQLRLQGLNPSELPESRTDNRELRDRVDTISKTLANSYQENQQALRQVAHALSSAKFELSIPGASIFKIPLFWSAFAIQAILFFGLCHLYVVRQSTQAYLLRVATAGMAEIRKHRALAIPVCPLALPLPATKELSVLLDGARTNSIAQWAQLLLSLTSFTLISCWLFYLNSQASRIYIQNESVTGQAFYAVSLSLALLTCLLSIVWLFIVPRISDRNELDGRTRRHTIFLVAGTALGISSMRPDIVTSLGKTATETWHRFVAKKPRYRQRRSMWLSTAKVHDGFLFDPISKKAHLVVAGRIMSVLPTERTKAAFANFVPRPIAIRVESSPTRSYTGINNSATIAISQVSQGLTSIAIERSVRVLLDNAPRAALELLRSAIAQRLPTYPPTQSKYLDLRLFDLYAKLCITNYDEERLQRFVTLLKNSSISYLVSDRIERWSDPKNKWRKRVLDYGRCSRVGYPVVGRCGFESRPATMSRNSRQWFSPISSGSN